MQRNKKLLVLAGVLAVMSAATYALAEYETKNDSIQNSEAVILEIDPDTVTTLSFETETGSFSFHKEDDTWIYDSDEDFPVDASAVENLLAEFSSLDSTFIIEEPEDLSAYGLDDPVLTVTLEADGETYTLTAGDFSKMDEERYVSIGDGNVYLVDSDPAETYDVGLYDLIDNDVTPVLYNRTKSLEIEGEESLSITYTEDNETLSYCADDVFFLDGTEPLDTDLVNSWLSSVGYISLDDYVNYKTEEEDLADYGLDDPDLTITAVYENSDEEEVTFTMSVVQPKEDGACYLHVEGSQIVYQIETDTYETLMACTYDDFRHPEVYTGDLDRVTSVDVMMDGTSYTFTNDDGTWKYNDEEIDMTDFETAMESITAEDYEQPESDSDEEIQLIIHQENETFPEVTVVINRYDGSTCTAYVDGKFHSTVSRAAVVDLKEAVNAVVLSAQ